MPSTPGMKEGGYYDANSSAQLASIQILSERILEAVQDLPLPQTDHPLTLLDLGSSEGRNARIVMHQIQARIRQGTDHPILTLYSDLPSNSFNQLAKNITDREVGEPLPPEVYQGMIPGSFYQPLMPPASVHLVTCFNAILWMDQVPSIPVSDFVVYRRPTPARAGLKVSPELESAFQTQARRDWIRFLESRAHELASGG